jgi:hypothetical protein
MEALSRSSTTPRGDVAPVLDRGAVPDPVHAQGERAAGRARRPGRGSGRPTGRRVVVTVSRPSRDREGRRRRGRAVGGRLEWGAAVDRRAPFPPRRAPGWSSGCGPVEQWAAAREEHLRFGRGGRRGRRRRFARRRSTGRRGWALAESPPVGDGRLSGPARSERGGPSVGLSAEGRPSPKRHRLAVGDLRPSGPDRRRGPSRTLIDFRVRRPGEDRTVRHSVADQGCGSAPGGPARVGGTRDDRGGARRARGAPRPAVYRDKGGR